MPEDRKTLRYRVLRYTPNLIRDEWVNVGIMLEEFQGLEAVGGTPALAVFGIRDAALHDRRRYA
jgi:hypothetical protein